MSILVDLFIVFCRIGLFSFGGGYAMIAMIENECVTKKQWLTKEELQEVSVIASSTPGPIAINAATYTGYKKANFLGAIVATLGIIFPSFVIIYILSTSLSYIYQKPLVLKAFMGIKIAVGLIIIQAGYKMCKQMPKMPRPLIFMGISLIATICFNIPSLHLLMIMAIGGLIYDLH